MKHRRAMIGGTKIDNYSSTSVSVCQQQELERTDDSRRGAGELSSRERVYGEGAGKVELASTQTTKYGGVAVAGGSSYAGNCSPFLPLLDICVISRRKAGLLLRSDDDGRQVRRFYQRYFTGVGVGGMLRVLTLTTSDEALALGKDIHRSWGALVKRMRRRWGRFEYMAVREIKSDRVHLHVVFRGNYMAQANLSSMWQAIHQSPVVDIRAVWSQRGGASYLAKYLAKGVASRYWASWGWVFKGWVSWSSAVKRVTGGYPHRAVLHLLARLDAVKRGVALEWLGWRYGLALDSA